MSCRVIYHQEVGGTVAGLKGIMDKRSAYLAHFSLRKYQMSCAHNKCSRISEEWEVFLKTVYEGRLHTGRDSVELCSNNGTKTLQKQFPGILLRGNLLKIITKGPI